MNTINGSTKIIKARALAVLLITLFFTLPSLTLANERDCDWTSVLNCLHNAQHDINAIWSKVNTELVNTWNAVKTTSEKTLGTIAEETQTTVNEIETTLGTIASATTNLSEDVISMLEISYGTAEEVLVEEYGKVDVFLGDGDACSISSPCGVFRTEMMEFLALAATVNHELIDFYEVLPEDFPTAQMVGLIEWIDEVPGYLLYPLYRAMTEMELDTDAYSDIFEQLSDSLAFLKALNSPITPVAAKAYANTHGLEAIQTSNTIQGSIGLPNCDAWVASQSDVADVTKWGTGISMSIKALGVILRAAGKTIAVDASVEAISPGAIIKSSPAKATGVFFSGLGDLGLMVFAAVNRRMNSCKLEADISDLKDEVLYLKTLICDYSPWFKANDRGVGKPKPLFCLNEDVLN